MAEPDRAAAPMVGKALEAAVVVLFVGTMTTALYGGVVPDYRGAAGSEVADRSLVAAAVEIEGAVPPNATVASAETTVDLPSTIRNANYRIRAGNGSVRLDHPGSGIGGERALALPDRVVRVEGSWHTGSGNAVVVETTGDGVVVRLEDR